MTRAQLDNKLKKLGIHSPKSLYKYPDSYGEVFETEEYFFRKVDVSWDSFSKVDTKEIRLWKKSGRESLSSKLTKQK